MIFISYYAAHILEFVIFLVIELFSFDAIYDGRVSERQRGEKEISGSVSWRSNKFNLNLFVIYIFKNTDFIFS